MKKTILLTSIFFIGLLAVHAEIHLPALIADNMVLQQQTKVKLWGTATANHWVEVKVSWFAHTYKTQSDAGGNWLISVKTPQAGGPYTISFSDGSETKVSNVLIGEVWLCAGQSNMEMPLKGYSGQPVAEAQNTIAKADPSVAIRLFKVEKAKSITPTNEIVAAWNENNPQSVKEFSATAYFFASYLQSVLKVPVGIIASSWGGANIEAFMDSATLSQFQKVNTPNINTGNLVHPKHCELYNGMIYPLRNFAIKGVLWYQGEANAGQYKLYQQEFPAMVAQWRNLWGIGDFPFYFAQIAPWKYKAVQATESARFREMQYTLKSKVPNSDMVVTVDTGDSLIIHSPMKKSVGERFAYLALNQTYHREGIEYHAPEFKSFVVKNDTIVLDFNFAQDGLHSLTRQIKGFEIAGSDRVFKPARVFLTDKATKIRLMEPSISNPVAARYAFRNYSPVSLFNNLGFPLAPFRTDDWDDNQPTDQR